MRRHGPNAYVSSVRLDWDQYYLDNVKRRVEGTWEGGGVDLLPLGGGVDRDSWGQNVDPEIAAQVDAFREKMMNGHSPFVGPIYDNTGELRVAEGVTMTKEELFAWGWLAEGVTASS